jgi:hypothetical protein
MIQLFRVQQRSVKLDIGHTFLGFNLSYCIPFHINLILFCIAAVLITIIVQIVCTFQLQPE